MSSHPLLGHWLSLERDLHAYCAAGLDAFQAQNIMSTLCVSPLPLLPMLALRLIQL